MNYAKIDSNGLILDVAVANSADVFPEGTWVECPDWLGIGLNINDPQPAPVEVVQPMVDGAQTL
jgi:hypothetical protein